MSSDSSICLNCAEEFKKVGKHFGRYSVTSLTSPRTLRKVFPGKFVSPVFRRERPFFLCTACTGVLRKETVPTPRRRKRTWKDRGSPSCSSTTSTLRQQSPVHKTARTGPRHSPSDATYRQKAVALLEAYKYKEAFRVLVKCSSAAKEAFLQVHCEILKEEVSVM